MKTECLNTIEPYIHDMATTMQVSKDLLKELKSRKMYDNESYEDIVWDLLEDTMELSEELEETSGLILWDGYLWTHNDNADTKLYGLEAATAEIAREYILPGP